MPVAEAVEQRQGPGECSLLPQHACTRGTILHPTAACCSNCNSAPCTLLHYFVFFWSACLCLCLQQLCGSLPGPAHSNQEAGQAAAACQGGACHAATADQQRTKCIGTCCGGYCLPPQLQDMRMLPHKSAVCSCAQQPPDADAHLFLRLARLTASAYSRRVSSTLWARAVVVSITHVPMYSACWHISVYLHTSCC